MDTDERIHIELLKSLKRFSKSYIPNEFRGKHKNSNTDNSPIIHQKHILKKKPLSDVDEKLFMLSHYYSKNKKYILIDQIKKVHKKLSQEIINWRGFSPKLKKMKKIDMNDNNINSPKHQHRHHKSTQLEDDFEGQCKFCKNVHYKTQNKPIKLNLVSQKFKIANDFNEENSNKFLNEKDECMKEVILSDKIEKEESSHFNSKNEEEKINRISTIKFNVFNESLFSKRSNIKKIEDDSLKVLSDLIKDLK